MSTEYFFKGTFKGVRKSRFVNEVCGLEDVEDLQKAISPIRITKVVHITHDREAARIETKPTSEKKSPFEFTAKNDREAVIEKKSPFEFTANKKIARSGTGKTIKVTSGETKIHDGELFPGFYSWWSLYPEDDILAKIEDEIDYLKTRDYNKLTVFVPNYLQKTSIYGKNAFVCDFRHLLICYAKSRSLEKGLRSLEKGLRSQEKGLRDVYIRVGGTLAYHYEICYVLIVCLVDDKDTLSGFTPLTKGDTADLFQLNDFIKSKGSINSEADKCLTFTPKHNITWANGEQYSYETTAFAFYFPDQQHCFQVERKSCSKEIYEHDKRRCIKKVDGECPDSHHRV